MPNWCSNIADFKCNKRTLAALRKYFTAMAKKEKKENQGQMPVFYTGDPGYMFEIRWEDDVLYYESKWGPTVEVIQSIANHFEISSFTLNYQELNMQIFGEYIFEKNVLINVCLDDEDFEKFDVADDSEDSWLFEGEVYDSDYTIMDILFERKKKAVLESLNSLN